MLMSVRPREERSDEVPCRTGIHLERQSSCLPAGFRVAGATRVIAGNIPNIAGIRSDPWTNYLVSVNQLQTNTGYTFFTALPAYVASVLRVKVDGQPIPVVPPPPTVNHTNGNSLVLSWPSGAGGFSLQQNTNLHSTNWTAYAGTVNSNVNTMTVIIPPLSSGNNFYRLLHP